MLIIDLIKCFYLEYMLIILKWYLKVSFVFCYEYKLVWDLILLEFVYISICVYICKLSNVNFLCKLFN